MRKFTLEVPATTANLGPGFDCAGLALSLCNRVAVTTRPGTDCDIDIDGLGADTLSRGPDNLVVVAMRHLFAKAHRELPGLHLALYNEVPLCSGLGSSSAAEIAGLVAANELLDHQFSDNDLLLAALELENHPDNITPALLGGFCIAIAGHTDSGWTVDAVRLPAPANLFAVTATPNLRIETVESRRALPGSYSRDDTVANVARASLLVASLAAGDHAALRVALADRLHQPYRLPKIRGAQAVLDAAMGAGAIGAVLSGSGPTLLALTEGEAVEAVAEAMDRTWRNAGVDVVVRRLRPRNAGARVVG